MGLNQTQLRI